MLEYEKPWGQRVDGWLFALLFVVTVAVWMVGLGMLVGLVLVGFLLASGEEFDPDARLSALYKSEVLGPTTLVQLAGMGLLVAGAVRLRGRSAEDMLALRRPGALALVLALVAGLFVGPFSGWFASVVDEFGGPLFTADHLVQVAEALLEGPIVPRAVLIFCVVVGAPILEELVFRGVAWSALEDSLPPVAVWLITSAGFALYHQNPLHVVALFATSLMLGWIRMVTGSVWAAMLAHFANNLVGVATMYLLGAEGDMGLTWATAIGCLLVTITACGAMLWRPRDPSSTA